MVEGLGRPLGIPRVAASACVPCMRTLVASTLSSTNDLAGQAAVKSTAEERLARGEEVIPTQPIGFHLSLLRD